ncbi:MAG: hypothetical protein ABI551_23520 [Polyangiaceae bacterium]
MIAKETAVSLLLAAAGSAGVAFLQPGLAARVHDVKEREDVYALPPPTELKLMTLGYKAAVVDQLWAKMLVEYGIHWGEHRNFTSLDNYIDAIMALEPDYAPLYHFAPTLLVYRPLQGYEKDARKARAVMEEGTRQRPEDWHVWMDYGQFIAYLAPSWLPEGERNQWRRDGAVAIAKAVELGADPDRSIDAAIALSKYGRRDAAVRELQRGYALTDDPGKRAEIAARLEQLQAATEREAVEHDLETLEKEWRQTYPFVSRGEYLMLGPKIDPIACAGPANGQRPECAHDWTKRLSPSR